jgi:hypothetical protein
MKNIKVGSFNLYNLVLPDHVYYENRSYSENDYKKKVSWIKSQVQSMGVQIIGFQEIFHKNALIGSKEGITSPQILFVVVQGLLKV